MHISTYGLNDMLLNASIRLQDAVATKEVQQASGLVGQTYGDLGSQAGYVIDLQHEISEAETWGANAQTASDRVQAMYSAVGNMISALNSLRSTLSGAISSGDSVQLNTEGQAVLGELADMMNTSQAGIYLFSGSRMTSPAVDVANPPYAASTDPTTANTSYYLGDDEKAAVRVSGQRTISYGVTADDAAFEQALRVANVSANVSATATGTIQSAYDLATTAISALSEIQSRLSVEATQFDQIQQRETTYVAAVQNVVSGVQSVDAAQVTAQISSYQAQLEASYAAIAKIGKISLVNYL